MLKDYLSKLLTLALMLFVCSAINAQISVTVNSPASVAGDYAAGEAVFGPFSGGISGDLVVAENAAGLTTACDVDLPITADLNGKIALIDRGACAFAQKALNAQAAGAIAVLLCSNDAAPDDVVLMGGNTCDLDIPIVSLSFNNCNIIKAEIANGVNVTFPDKGVGEGEFLDHEFVLPGAGIYTATEITGDTLMPEVAAPFTGAAEAAGGLFYSIIAPQSGVMNVNSCLGGADTDLSVLQGCRSGYAVVGRNDDDCELSPGGDEWASNLDVLVNEGEEYIIAWTDRWSTSGFDFEVSFGDAPTIDVTFTVDMQNETVAADGVYILGTPTGGVETAMTDNGDGTWSWTVVGAPAGSFHTWQYLNGTGNAEDASALEACGVDNGAGGFIRAATLNSLEDIVLPAVCYASCFACPSDEPTDCAQPFTLITENFDSYAAGDGIVDVSDDWINWPAAGVVSSLVSDEQALSGGLSLKLDGTDAAAAEFEDPILVLDGQISGNYRFGWAMYIPEGNSAYFNIQHFDDMFGGAQGGEWAAEMFLEQDGAGSISVESVSYPFSYPNGGWFDVRFNVDVTNDWVTMYINNVHVLGWQLSLQSNAGASAQSLGAINFYPRDINDIYYVDDVYYQQIPAALDGNGYCHVATPIDLGVHTMTGADCFGGPDQVNAPGAAWYAYTAAEDGYVFISSCGAGSDTRVWIFDDCNMRGTLGVNDDECAMMAGSTTSLFASYKEFPVTAGETYYIVWDNRWLDDGETHDFELGFFADEFAGDFCQTAIDIDLGTHSFDSWGFASQSGPEYGAFGDRTAYTRSKWFTYTPDEDILVRLYNCDLAVQDTRAWIYVGECGSYESLDLVVKLDNDCATQEDFTWDAVAGTTYYIEWDDKGEDIEGHEFALEEVILETVSVTYQVDMSFYLANGGTLETIKIAGNFATNGAIDMVDWDPTQSPAFTDIGDDIFETTIQYLVSSAGQDQLYKYLNTADSWGACGIDQECFENAIDLSCTDGTADNNRIFTIPSEDATVCFTFDYCTACNETATREQLIDIPMTIAPNPFSQEAIVTFNEAIFEAEASLTTLTGQVARTYQVNGTQLIIEKENLSPGVYFFTVTTAEGVSTAEKLIVQ